MKAPCVHGCDMSWIVNNQYKAEHERKPHFRCSCMRIFGVSGINRHLGVRRSDHPTVKLIQTFPPPKRPDMAA